jgi:Holliday junction DNA helicase RuvA
MIARLEGMLVERSPTRVIVDVGGVGYEAHIPLSTFARLPDEGKTVALRIHTHVREEALLLYGFATALEKAAFEMLLHASRVGPKLAQTILSGIDTPVLVRAIQQGDIVTLKGVPGVGAKTAERIVVELRDRVAELVPDSADGGDPLPRIPLAPEDDLRGELISALINLQTQRPKAERVSDEVLAELGLDAPIEDLVRAALKRLAR